MMKKIFFLKKKIKLKKFFLKKKFKKILKLNDIKPLDLAKKMI